MLSPALHLREEWLNLCVPKGPGAGGWEDQGLRLTWGRGDSTYTHSYTRTVTHSLCTRQLLGGKNLVMGSVSQTPGREQAACRELIASLIPGQHPHQQLMSSQGKEGPDRRGVLRRLEKASERGRRRTAVRALLTKGCKKPDGSGRPSQLSPSLGGASRQPCACPLLLGCSPGADNPPP